MTTPWTKAMTSSLSKTREIMGALVNIKPKSNEEFAKKSKKKMAKKRAKKSASANART